MLEAASAQATAQMVAERVDLVERLAEVEDWHILPLGGAFISAVPGRSASRQRPAGCPVDMGHSDHWYCSQRSAPAVHLLGSDCNLHLPSVRQVSPSVDAGWDMTSSSGPIVLCASC